VYIDALPLDGIDNKNTPFIKQFIDNGTTYVLENIMGYSFGIQSTLLSGKLPSETEQWMPYIYSSNINVPVKSKVLAYVTKTFGTDMNLPFQLRRVCNMLTSNFVFRKGAKIGSIPWFVIDKFYIRPYYYMHELPAYNELKESLYSQRIKTLYFGPRLHKDPINNLIKFIDFKINNNKHDNVFIILYLDALDGAGHKFGVGSNAWIEALRKIDHNLGSLYKFLNSKANDHHLALFSDHQMCNAKYTINIPYYLRKSGLEMVEDVVIFIDATITLIWVEKESKRNHVLTTLEKIGADKIIVFDKESSAKLLEKYGVLFKDRIYGDIIVQVRPNYVFFPNFYSDIHALTGVHGFLPNEKYQQSFLTLGADFDFKKIPRLSHVKDIRKFIENWF
jgi:hypothetical protein